MKILITLMTLALSISSFASSGQDRYFNIDSSIDTVEGILHGEKTHTEYETRTVRTTCYRTETTYRTICTNPPRRYPHPHPPRHPHPRPRFAVEPSYHGTICQTVPHTRTVAYTCTKTEQIPYEVKDYDVEARVSINIINASEFQDAKEVISVHLFGDSIHLKATGSKKYFIMLKDRQLRSSMSGGTKFMDVNYQVELVEAADILATLSLGSMKVENNGLNFEVGKLSDIDQLSFKLKIVQNKLFGSDPVLIDRTLLSHEFELSSLGNKTLARVDFSRLNLDVRGAKFNITAAVEFKDIGKLLNNADFPNLRASRTLTYKAR